MHRGRLIAAVITGILIAGTGLAAGLAAAAGATTTAHAAAQRPRDVGLDCSFKPQVKPGTYVLTCADAGIGLERMRWTSWTQKLASGYGSEWENDCRPNCAAGHLHHYPVLAVLWGSGSVQGHPAERRYTQLTLIYTGARPPVYKLEHGKVVATYPATQTFPALLSRSYRGPSGLASAVAMIRSMSAGSGRPLAAHIIGKPDEGVIPGMVLISLTMTSPAGV